MTWLTNSMRFGGGVAASPEHRYWEVYSLAGIDGSVGMSELAFAASPGGANLITSSSMLSGVAYESATAPGSVATLLDGNPATYSNQGQPPTHGVCWRVDLGATQLVYEVRITALTPGAPPNRTIDTFMVRGSDDLSTWYTYLVVIRAAWSSTTEQKTFVLGPRYETSGRAHARGWRLYGTTTVSGSGSFNLGEMQWAATVGGSALNTLASSNPDAATAAIGTPFDKSIIGGWGYGSVGPNLASDGNTSNRYAGNRTPYFFIGFIFPAAQDCAELRLYPDPGGTGNMVKDFVIQYTTDFNTWTTVATPAPQTGWTGGVARSFTF